MDKLNFPNKSSEIMNLSVTKERFISESCVFLEKIRGMGFIEAAKELDKMNIPIYLKKIFEKRKRGMAPEDVIEEIYEDFKNKDTKEGELTSFLFARIFVDSVCFSLEGSILEDWLETFFTILNEKDDETRFQMLKDFEIKQNEYFRNYVENKIREEERLKLDFLDQSIE